MRIRTRTTLPNWILITWSKHGVRTCAYSYSHLSAMQIVSANVETVRKKYKSITTAAQVFFSLIVPHTTQMQQQQHPPSQDFNHLLIHAACATSTPPYMLMMNSGDNNNNDVSQNKQQQQDEDVELMIKMACMSSLHRQELSLLDAAFNDAFQCIHTRLVNASCLNNNSAMDCSTPITPMTPANMFSSDLTSISTSPNTPTSASSTCSNTSQHNSSSAGGRSSNVPDPEIVKKLKSQYNDATLQQAKISKKRKGYPKHITAILNHWYEEHYSYPYPSQAQKEHLANQTGLTIVQLNNWFSNTRLRTKRRLKKEKQSGGNTTANTTEKNEEKTSSPKNKKKTKSTTSKKKSAPSSITTTPSHLHSMQPSPLVIPQQPATPAMVITQPLNPHMFYEPQYYQFPPTTVYQQTPASTADSFSALYQQQQQQQQQQHQQHQQHQQQALADHHAQMLQSTGNSTVPKPEDIMSEESFHSFDEEMQNHAPQLEDPHLINALHLLKRDSVSDPMRISSPSSEIEDYANKLCIANLVGDHDLSHHDVHSIFHF
jgi:hypothetical protein